MLDADILHLELDDRILIIRIFFDGITDIEGFHLLDMPIVSAHAKGNGVDDRRGVGEAIDNL